MSIAAVPPEQVSLRPSCAKISRCTSTSGKRTEKDGRSSQCTAQRRHDTRARSSVRQLQVMALSEANLLGLRFGKVPFQRVPSTR